MKKIIRSKNTEAEEEKKRLGKAGTRDGLRFWEELKVEKKRSWD
jgi:hypothetical protein